MRARYTRRLVTTPDGGTIGLDWWSGSHKGHIMHAASPVVLCLHAFAGKVCDTLLMHTCCGDVKVLLLVLSILLKWLNVVATPVSELLTHCRLSDSNAQSCSVGPMRRGMHKYHLTT